MIGRLSTWVTALLFVFGFLMFGCGGGGSPALPDQLMVSGTVQAPNGQLAFQRESDSFEVYTSFFLPRAFASVSGVGPVSNGTVVELAKIDNIGNIIEKVSTTTTSGGDYSFNLTMLGLNFSSELMVQVVNTDTGARMRALVTKETVNIDPISEASIRIILEQIATKQNTTLNYFTNQEIIDLEASIDLLSRVNKIVTGVDLEATLLTIKEGIVKDQQLMAFIASASESDQTTVGPGDIGNFFPIVPGNIWRFQGTISEDGGPPVQFFNTAITTGTKLVKGVSTSIWTETNFENSGTIDEDFLSKESRGIFNWGNNDFSDGVTPQLVPFKEAVFPLRPGSSFEQLNNTNMDFGEDLDGDGINDVIDVKSQVSIIAFEEVTVPVGSFRDTAKIEIKNTATITLSKNNKKITGLETVIQWFAPDVGPIKRTSEFQILREDISSTVVEELIGYEIDGKKEGNLPPLVSNISSHSVGEHALALKTDGTVWAWGENGWGQLGDGTSFKRTVPIQVSGLENVIEISAGAAYSLALKGDGTVWAWGTNEHGQLGDGNRSEGRKIAAQVLGLTDVVAISASVYHSLALKRDGSLWEWGFNNQGLAEGGNPQWNLIPVPATGHLDNIKTIMAAPGISLVLKKNGSLWGWGSNFSGAFGDLSVLLHTTPVQITRIPEINKIGAGEAHVLAVDSSGMVWTWGRNTNGQLGRVTPDLVDSVPNSILNLSGVLSVAGGPDYSLALKNDGTVWTWGRNIGPQSGPGSHVPVQIENLQKVTTVTAGWITSYALVGHAVWTWGLETQFQMVPDLIK